METKLLCALTKSARLQTPSDQEDDGAAEEDGDGGDGGNGLGTILVPVTPPYIRL